VATEAATLAGEDNQKGKGALGPLLFALNPFSPINVLTAGILVAVYFSILKQRLMNNHNPLYHETWMHILLMISAYLGVTYAMYFIFCRFFVQHIFSKLPVIGLIFGFICGL
tara:strand:- start:31 stop:366 length:336 start_codon:yes stop_codon:yes gene_type:complete